MKTTLDIYKELKSQRNDIWEIAVKMSMYNSIGTFVDNPTDEEYKIISDVCYRAYMKAEKVDFIRLCDRVSEEYSLGDITLEELKEMTAWQLLDKFEC